MQLLKVKGDSMSPVLADGDYIFTIKAKPRSLRPGFIYVINHSDLGIIVKRLKRLKNDMCIFCGDNQNSTPSSILGPVAKSRVTGKAIFALTKSGLKRL